MGSFAESVAYLQPQVAGMASDPELRAFIGASERLTEAAAVERCVDRATCGELDPSGELAISRNRTTRGWLPGLGWYLESKGRFERCGNRQIEAMAEAVRRALALGWLFSCTPQAHPVDRSEQKIWAFWAPSVVGGELGKLFGDSLANKIKEDSGILFREELREADVIGRRGRLKVEMIGTHLATLGVILRMLQTSEIGADAIKVTPPQTRGSDGRWAWQRYPDDQLALP